MKLKNPIDKLTFKQILWMIPVFVTIHNLEEAPSMANWLMRHVAIFPLEKLPLLILKSFLQLTTAQFWIATLFLDVLVFCLTYFCLKRIKKGIYLLMITQLIMFLNAFTHISWTVLFRQYVPGVATAAFFNIPFSSYLFRRVFREGYINKKNLVLIFLLSIILYPIMAGFSLLVARIIVIAYMNFISSMV